MKESLLILPLEDVTENPSPISTPLTAPIDITALAREASSLSKTGSPDTCGHTFNNTFNQTAGRILIRKYIVPNRQLPAVRIPNLAYKGGFH